MKLTTSKRNLAHLTALIFFTTVTLGLTACNQSRGLTSLSSAASNGTSSTGTGSQDLWTPALQAMSGVVNGGPYDELQIIQINQATMTITIKFPLPGNLIGGAMVSMPIPQVPGATAGIMQDPTTLQWYLEYSMPLADLVKGINFGKSTTLPNGNSLPGVPGGELPEISTQVQNQKVDAYVYGAVQYFAVFIPTPGFNPYVSLTWPVKNAAGTKVIGYIGTVAQQTTFAGGIYLALVFPTELQILLDNLFPK